MATRIRQRTSTETRVSSTSAKKGSEGGRELSDKALQMRKERLIKEQEQKKKMVYMIIGPGLILIVIVLIAKAFMGSSGSDTATRTRVVHNYKMTQQTPKGARPQMKKILAIIADSRGMIKRAATSEDNDTANKLYEEANVKLTKAMKMTEELTEKYPGEWADPVLQKIQTLMYTSNKSTSFNYY